MAKRIPQRDVNLANKLMNLAQSSIAIAQGLLDPINVQLADNWHQQLQDSLFDSLGAAREHRRKVSPIELKGQRG